MHDGHGDGDGLRFVQRQDQVRKEDLTGHQCDPQERHRRSPGGVALQDQSDSRLSPKLGVVWWGDDHFGLYGSIGTGFKAPTPLQVNSAFSNPLFGYVSIPNA